MRSHRTNVITFGGVATLSTGCSPAKGDHRAKVGRLVILFRALVALCCAGYLSGAIVTWRSPTVSLVMGDFGLSAAGFCAALSCLVYACRRPRSRARLAWLLFAFSSLMSAAGNAVWGWYEVVLGRPLPPGSPADYCFLLFAPPALAGLLLLAKWPTAKLGWICFSLDSLLITGSLLTLSWSLALSFTARAQSGNPGRIALALAYPLLDVFLVSMVLALHFQGTANRASVRTALLALAVTLLCDGLYTMLQLGGRYTSGGLLDAGWFAGSMLFSLAPWAGSRTRDTSTGPPKHPTVGSPGTLTPYVSAAVCSLGTLINLFDGRQVDRVVLVLGCTVAIALVVRQGILLVDNISLTQELASKENHFRSLVQGSSDVIMIVDTYGVLEYVSPAAKGVYGRFAEDLVGSHIATLIHPDDVEHVLSQLSRFRTAAPVDEPATRIECRIRSSAGSWLNVESTVNGYRDGLILNSRDVTERVRLQTELKHNAAHDSLTALPNRMMFADEVGQALAAGREVAVLYIDLDGFKAVNDSIGHLAGDELLIDAARRLRRAVRSQDMVARLGGDEFAALVRAGSPEGNPGRPGGTPGKGRESIKEIAERVQTTLSEAYQVQNTPARVTASIGVAFAEPGISPDELVRNADLAMYRAKRAGKGRVEMYEPQLREVADRHTELVSRLRAAVANRALELAYQPVVDLGTGRVAMFQAQPDWQSDSTQSLRCSPEEFWTLAEDANRSAELSRLLLEEAVAQVAVEHAAGQRAAVAVKFSAGQLLKSGPAPEHIEALLTRHQLPASSVVLEVTDDRDVAMRDLAARLTSLRQLGVRIILGGFGAGHARLAALYQLPADVVRLDRSLVDGLVASSPAGPAAAVANGTAQNGTAQRCSGSTGTDAARLHKLVIGMLRLASDLGLATVADGVDLPAQVSVLRALGCDYAQGAAVAGRSGARRLSQLRLDGCCPLPAAANLLPARGLETTPVSWPGAVPATARAWTLPMPRVAPEGHPEPLWPDNETSVPPA